MADRLGNYVSEQRYSRAVDLTIFASEIELHPLGSLSTVATPIEDGYYESSARIASRGAVG